MPICITKAWGERTPRGVSTTSSSWSGATYGGVYTMGWQDGGKRVLLLVLLWAAVCTVCAEAASTASRRCPTCSSSSPPETDVQGKVENALRLELIKRQILDRLGLDARPNITKAVPRRAIHSALRRLHAEDLITQVATPAPEDQDLDGQQQEQHEEVQTVEIISFAEAGKKKATEYIQFKTSENNAETTVASRAVTWVFLKLYADKMALRKPVSVTVDLARVKSAGPGLQQLDTVVRKTLLVTRSGWHSFNVAAALRDVLETGEKKVTFRVRCHGCGSVVKPMLLSDVSVLRRRRGEEGAADGSSLHHKLQDVDLDEVKHPHHPFLVLRTRSKPGKRRSKRQADRGACRKHSLFVSFEQLGWDDWIIAPMPGYQANFCAGECPSVQYPETTASFHALLGDEKRFDTPYATYISPCCTPTKMSSISMLYFDKDNNIVKADVRNMVVDECGCK
ncbi:PREDICTED: inhibin beta B chain-like [Branchiostoma belcheri]|uniref:Inhibin beta B chain-like n=1 Tax=Branchiostoma belcheri TaxID=7741 RepID=A0A6P4Z0Q3_BRABE|nr:PREDICTED: inhibin beta B chain-like [Branchiostoma belcheri]